MEKIAMKEDNVTGKDLGAGNGNPDPAQLCHSLVPQNVQRLNEDDFVREWKRVSRESNVVPNWIDGAKWMQDKLFNQSKTDERIATQQAPNHGTEPLSPNNTLVQQNVGEGEGGSQRSELSSDSVVSLTASVGNSIEQFIGKRFKVSYDRQMVFTLKPHNDSEVKATWIEEDGKEEYSTYSMDEALRLFKNDVWVLLPKEPAAQVSDTRDDAMKDQQPATNASPSTSREELAIDWISVEKSTPVTYKTGNFDGKKSDLVLTYNSNREEYKIARLYEGYLDGNHFKDWYDEKDFDIDAPTHWKALHSPIYQQHLNKQ